MNTTDAYFTTDWFTNNIPNLASLFKGCNETTIKALEIGSWEGRSTTWFLENALHHEESKITCIDPWPSSEVFIRFVYNIRDYINKVDIRKGYSSDVLRTLNENTFDFIYIDGSHTSWNTLEDAVLSFKLLKTNGVMIFDDYKGGDIEDTTLSPYKGINAFIEVYSKHIEVLHKEYQVFIRKKPTETYNLCSTAYAQ